MYLAYCHADVYTPLILKKPLSFITNSQRIKGWCVQWWLTLTNSWFGLAHFENSWCGLAHFRNSRFGLAHFGNSRFGLAHFGNSQFGLAHFGNFWFDAGLLRKTFEKMLFLQISAFFLFSNFRKRQIALYSPCWSVGRSVGWSVGRSVTHLFFFGVFRAVFAPLLLPNHTRLILPCIRPCWKKIFFYLTLKVRMFITCYCKRCKR